MSFIPLTHIFIFFFGLRALLMIFTSSFAKYRIHTGDLPITSTEACKKCTQLTSPLIKQLLLREIQTSPGQRSPCSCWLYFTLVHLLLTWGLQLLSGKVSGQCTECLQSSAWSSRKFNRPLLTSKQTFRDWGAVEPDRVDRPCEGNVAWD